MGRKLVLAVRDAKTMSNSYAQQQRSVVVMFDGLGLDYLSQSPTPTMQTWSNQGIFAAVQSVMPTVTNANNASVCCGCFPEEHGVIGNSYFDARTGTEAYLEESNLLCAPTIFERAAHFGLKSALLTSKKKTISLLGRGATECLAAEAPSAHTVARYGQAPDIYSREINYWLTSVAIDILKNRPDIALIYLHTTDYAMHMWPPQANESKEHIATIDSLLSQAAAAAPDAAFLITADHGMNYKRRCWDLEKALARRGAPIRLAISAERDKYLRHHRGMGGTSWVYLTDPVDEDRVTRVLLGLDGVEQVLSREEAAHRFRLMASRIGDLVVLADHETVFGNLEQDECEELPSSYRSHGSLYEQDVPLIIHNAQHAPPKDYFRYNVDLARWLYPISPTGAHGEAVTARAL